MNIQSALIRSILERWEHYDWTIQGFGMARVKIADVGRIHVWDSRLRVPLVSDIHAHPWDLKSTIISGELVNQRFEKGSEEKFVLPYLGQTLKTGEGGGLVDLPEEVWLYGKAPEFYCSGCSYTQTSNEIHRSIPFNGCVTLIEREQGPPLQETFVYWPRGTEWVSAEPREPRGDYEIAPIISLALAKWNAV